MLEASLYLRNRPQRFGIVTVIWFNQLSSGLPQLEELTGNMGSPGIPWQDPQIKFRLKTETISHTWQGLSL